MRTVLVTVDAVRADHLGQYGYHRDTMPAVDRLVDEGTLFEAGFANGPHSGVSIPSLLSSRYRGREALERGPNVATALSEAGVRTAAFHSNTMLANEVGNVSGFDEFEDFGVGGSDVDHERLRPSTSQRLFGGLKSVVAPVVGEWSVARRLYGRFAPETEQFQFQAYVDAETLTDRAVDWLADAGEEDFFCWLHYMDPHRPYGVDPDDPAYADGPVADDEIRELMTRAGTEPDAVTPADRERLIDLYDSDLRYTSDHLDRLFDGIETHCGFEETLVALTADHGEEFGEHGQYFHRNRPYDELLAVPLVVRHPDEDRERVRKPRELLDLAPTVCEFHDAPTPEAFEGRSLYDGADRKVVASGALDAEASVAAVRTGAWKYIHVEDGADELYDLTADADEQTNLAAEEPDRVDSLRGSIPADLLTVDSQVSAADATGETRERLERLGYLD